MSPTSYQAAPPRDTIYQRGGIICSGSEVSNVLGCARILGELALFSRVSFCCAVPPAIGLLGLEGLQGRAVLGMLDFRWRIERYPFISDR